MSWLAPAVRTVTRSRTAGVFRDPLPLHQRRARLERASRAMPRPRGVDYHEERLGDCRALRARPRSSDPYSALLYLHGGSYVAGSPDSHAGLAGRLARAAGCDVWILDYRLAPEDPFPAARNDAVAAYKALLSAGLARIVLGGDSAGGGIALATALELRQVQTVKPAALLLLAPWLDLTLSGHSVRSRITTEVMLGPVALADDACAYAGPGDERRREISPLFADLAGLPPTLAQVGDHDILLADTERFEQRARAAGVEVEAQVWSRMWHVWHTAAPVLPEANVAIEQCGSWLRGRFAVADTPLT